MIDIPLGNPTPDQVKAARNAAGLTQREASKVIFGPDSPRTLQNWEEGRRVCPKRTFVLFLLMTGQVTIQQVKRCL